MAVKKEPKIFFLSSVNVVVVSTKAVILEKSLFWYSPQRYLPPLEADSITKDIEATFWNVLFLWSTKPSQFDWRQCKQISGIRFGKREKEPRKQTSLLSECFAGKHQNTHTEEKLVVVLSFHKPPMKLSRFCEYNGTNFPKKEELSLKKLPQIVSKEVPL